MNVQTTTNASDDFLQIQIKLPTFAMKPPVEISHSDTETTESVEVDETTESVEVDETTEIVDTETVDTETVDTETVDTETVEGEVSHADQTIVLPVNTSTTEGQQTTDQTQVDIVVDDHAEDIMIALLPVDTSWCKQEFPHLTLVYVGNVMEMKESDRNELAKECLSLALACPAIELDVLGIDILGTGLDRVEALLLRPTPQLMAMRAMVDTWNASQYHSYLPHATIGPIGSTDGTYPDTIVFDRIVLSWGNDNLIFELLNGKPVYEAK